MKKTLMILSAVFAFGFANAQEEVKEAGNGGFAKGDLFVSGAFGFSSDKTGDAKSSSFEIEPKVGYFVTENIAIGAKLGFGSEKAEDAAGNETQDDSSFTFGAFGRYYMTPANQFSVFGQLGVDFTNTEDNLADAKMKEFGINAGLGLSYFVSNNFAIEASWAGLGYTSNDNGGNGADKTNSFGLEVDMRAINFGLIYKF
ncbi:outer membrane beta-barrel protein [Flavobacterium pedocola]